MNIKIITVGTLKEQYLKDAADEYIKRLSRYAKCEMIEINESKLPDDPSEGDVAKALLSEAKQIEAKCGKSKDCIFALCVEGMQKTSEDFANTVSKATVNGKDTLTFIIGSSHGLQEAIKSTADYRLSFSKMTFPHQLMRVILLEQVYRAMQINNGGKYHK